MFVNPFNELGAIVTYSSNVPVVKNQIMTLNNGDVVRLYEANYMTPTFCNQGRVFG